MNELPDIATGVCVHLDEVRVSEEDGVIVGVQGSIHLRKYVDTSEQDAQDVAQEAYLRAFRFFPGFRGGDARAWLLKIVRNTCYTWLQTNRPMQGATEFDENLFPSDSRGANPEEAVLQKDNDALLRRALQKLPPSFREVIVLRELEGISYREIADITGMPAGTVMSSLSRARGRLRQVLTALVSGHAVPTSPRIAAMNV
jgi:RNA polymerase sigma-70 factor (ECF subfamily)